MDDHRPKEATPADTWPVPYVVIDERQRDAYFASGYNPPGTDEDMTYFYAERRRSLATLRAAISVYYRHGFSEDSDFFMSEDYDVADRFLCIEVGNESILTLSLVKIAHAAIMALDEDYSVDICNAWTVLKTQDGDSYPDFNIIIEKQRILIYSESQMLHDTLGVREIHEE